MTETMTIVDLAKARAYAATGLTCTDTAADWILQLADEVESLERALHLARDAEQAARAAAQTSRVERDTLAAGLEDLYTRVAALIGEARQRPGES